MMETNNINPNFDNLNNPETIKQHFEKLTNSNVILHDQLLCVLLEQVQPIDFKDKAFPQIAELKERLKHLTDQSDEYHSIKKEIESYKVGLKHYLIISIENVLSIANRNKWGLCKKHDFIYLYNGQYWQEVDKELFQNFLGEASEKMGVVKFTSKHYEFREKLYRQFLSMAYLPEPENRKDAVLINLKNGTFRITANESKLTNFDSKNCLTYQLPFAYDKTATVPIFQKYLDTVIPDKEKQNILAEYLGLVFIKNGNKAIKEEKALILYGTGANGKSVFFEIVNALLGDDNVSNYSLSSLTNDNGYFRAKIANKLVNYASEINGKLEASIFKQLVSGEPVEARLPYGQPFTLREYARLIFNCNELPKDVEQTNAYFRRFLIIPFDVTIPEHEQDKELHNKIIDNELSGVFNWVLSGLDRLLSQKGFTKCNAVIEAVERYKSESNSVLMFLEDKGYKKSLEEYQRLSALYIEYKNFCIEDGMLPFKKSNFSKQLKNLGFVSDRQSGTGQNIVFIGV
ncbi:DNA primase family protein [Sphingobacterium rhinopitheci]|uniref:DNA primase family protein n=1 Tax=Sphingobacterium rhinopitheci TaxID=2781960 RepID=UPI001F527648|nr:DNA primase family protein [Sphingobacterium rhinopitheci]